jgi:anti-anti-sigma factor
MNSSLFFEVEQIGRTVIVTVFRDNEILTFDEMVYEAREVFELLSSGRVENVVVDLHKLSICASAILGFFVKLRKTVQEAGGQMAFCNLSKPIRDIMRVSQTDRMWAICDSRADALAEVEK